MGELAGSTTAGAAQDVRVHQENTDESFEAVKWVGAEALED
jgi:hypothetical protein